MAADTQQLTQEHTEKIVQFQEVTGTEDVGEARSVLENHAWDLEAAVQDHLALRESPPLTPHPTPQGSRSENWQEMVDRGGGSGGGGGEGSGGEGRSQENSEDVVGARRRTSEDTGGRSGGNGVGGGGSSGVGGGGSGSGGGILSTLFARYSLLGWGYYLLTLPFRFTLSSLSSILLFVYRIIYPYPRRLTDPLGDVLAFISEYETEFSPQHPAFFQGSYSQALSHAKAELKFLLVYLHCRDHQHTPDFCRNSLSDPNLVEYINSTMVFWGCSVTSPEGYRVSQALRENSYPFLALVVLRDGRMAVVGRLEGPAEPATLMQRLQGIVRENEAHLVVARAERQERELTAALRLQQDEDYQQSLRADQEKERRRQMEREEAQRRVEEERQREEDQQRERDNIRRLKVEWVDRVPQEPDEGAPGVIHISVKLPQGTRLERRFLNTDSLAALYYYIFCHPHSPDRFQVTSNFPRRVVPCEPRPGQPPPPTFQEFRLPPRSMLFVSDLDA